MPRKRLLRQTSLYRRLEPEKGISNMSYPWRVALALFSIGMGSAFGQATASGTIQGTVFDQTQAVIPGATVLFTHKTTGETRTTLTKETGNYRISLQAAV